MEIDENFTEQLTKYKLFLATLDDQQVHFVAVSLRERSGLCSCETLEAWATASDKLGPFCGCSLSAFALLLYRR
ncbi:hypothetical protein J6590_027789 [Homalodisca vitripennis]|nr:hypothetical protein J6590_027789 [Homalodisca vitripennis]